MKTFFMVQYSPEWWEARAGIPTASNFGRILTASGKLSAQADDYACELIGEAMNPSAPFFTERGGHTAAMRNGQNTEPEARKYYTLETGNAVQQVGFCLTDDGRFGCSPDGLVGDDGCLELKCPLAKTQIGYLLEGKLPTEYRPQVHGQLIVTGRAYVDFLSYVPLLNPLLIRVTADEYTDRLRVALDSFWERLQTIKDSALIRGK